MTSPIITIDTDSAVIRLYLDAARAAGITDDGIVRLQLDAQALATAIGSVTGCRFRVLAVGPGPGAEDPGALAARSPTGYRCADCGSTERDHKCRREPRPVGDDPEIEDGPARYRRLGVGEIVDEIQSDANARGRAHVFVASLTPGLEHTCTGCGSLEHDEEQLLVGRLLPAPLAIDDLLEIAAKAKACRLADAYGVELSDDEAHQLGEGLEILASDLESERRQRAAEHAAREQVARETAAETARLCGLIDELRYELRERRSRVADLERRITAANDQAERDLDDAHRSYRSPPRDNAAYELPDAEIAGFVVAAREEQEETRIVHPLAALADRIEILHAGSERYPEVRSCRMRLVRLADFEALIAAVARR